jgi:hypothetical protein
MNTGLIDSPETSVSNRLTPRNNPEDGRIQLTAAEVYDLKVTPFVHTPRCEGVWWRVDILG